MNRLIQRALLLGLVLLGVAALPAAWPTPAHPAPPGVNGKIVFNGPGGSAIYVMDADGGNRVQLTNDPFPVEDGYAKWSPDGTTIYFYRDIDGDSATIQDGVWAMNADGTNLRFVTDGPHRMAWVTGGLSPDGTKLAFATGAGIAVSNLDGTGQTQVTNDPLDGPPYWSPDGTKLAFTSERDGADGLYVVGVDGTGLTPVLVWSPSVGVDPVWSQRVDWSPDGTKLVFSGDVPTGGATTFRGIFVIGADGTGLTQLTTQFDPNYNEADDYAVWAPDGTKIVFQRPTPTPDVYMMNPDGSGLTSLGSGEAPDWQRAPADTVAPVVTFHGNAGSYGVLDTVAITCTAADPAPGSGLAVDPCTGFSIGGPAWSFGPGAHTLPTPGLVATDGAGNSSAPATVTFTVAAAPGDLATLTLQLVQGSARYAALSPAQKRAVDAIGTAATRFLTAIVPRLGPVQKAALIRGYVDTVQLLARGGWLTPAQANMLAAFAQSL